MSHAFSAQQGAQAPVAVVTGGSTGIGLATASRLLKMGFRVAFFSHQAARVDTALKELEPVAPSSHILGMSVDLRDVAAVRAFFATVSRTWEPATVLVCNAAFSPKKVLGNRKPLDQIDLEEWNDVLTVNLTGSMLCTQCVLPAMVERKQGRIIFIGSVAGRTLPRIAGASYTASKSALVGLSRAIVAEYSRFGITSNTICPGRIMTEMTGDPDSPVNRAVLERIPIGRLGTMEDVARTVAFLAHSEADFINGAVIDVNGGEFAAP